MGKSRRRPRHRRSHRATRVAAPVVVGGVVAAAAFGASPLADHLRPGGPARTTDAGGATGGPSPAVVLAQPVGTAAAHAGGSSREAASTPTDTGATPHPSESALPTQSAPAPSAPTPADPEPSDPVPLPLPTLTSRSLPPLPSLPLPTQGPTLPLPTQGPTLPLP